MSQFNKHIEILKKNVFGIFVPLTIIYVLFLIYYSQNGFPLLERIFYFMPYVSDKIIGEDGYYMLHVAWNIAQGHGISYNYDVLTTGIQPLATFFYAL